MHDDSFRSLDSICKLIKTSSVAKFTCSLTEYEAISWFLNVCSNDTRTGQQKNIRQYNTDRRTQSAKNFEMVLIKINYKASVGSSGVVLKK